MYITVNVPVACVDLTSLQGNVNLRTCFADIHREAMFPVHCAVLGGNIKVLQWLVDTQLCPLSVTKENGHALSLQTSASRTLLDLAMTGRPKVDILRFLISHGLSITDVKDSALAPKTLQYVLKTNADVGLVKDPSTDLIPCEDSVATADDACALCCERSMDCVLIPCGHQICCTECGHQLQKCPTCKVNCSVLRVFRQ